MSQPRSVLVIEDDQNHQLLARLHLEGAGHHVETVASLHDGLALLDVADDLYDVLVVDLHLPDHDGAHTIELIRATTVTPVIVWSSEPGDRIARTLAEGAAAAITKTEPERLPQLVEEVVRGGGRYEHRSPESAPDTIDFTQAAKRVVDGLAGLDTLSTWLVTRVVGDEWLILALHDENYELREGQVLRWSDSFCCRMVDGLGPRIVPDTEVEPVYSAAPIARQLDIGAYVGVPLVLEGGQLFGTLCGIQPDPHPDPSRLRSLQPHVELVAATLASALALDLDRTRLQRRVEVAAAAARTDLLTGLGNRRSWDNALRAEDARCARFGHLAGVVIVDLDGLKTVNDREGHAAGDDLIRRAAAAIGRTIRGNDLAFRLGGDEFGLLLPESGDDDLAAVIGRLRDAFEIANVSAAIGAAVRHGTDDLWAAVEAADAAMYHEKTSRPGRS